MPRHLNPGQWICGSLPPVLEKAPPAVSAPAGGTRVEAEGSATWQAQQPRRGPLEAHPSRVAPLSPVLLVVQAVRQRAHLRQLLLLALQQQRTHVLLHAAKGGTLRRDLHPKNLTCVQEKKAGPTSWTIPHLKCGQHTDAS